MRWWQIKKRDEDLQRELASDLALEEEEQREQVCLRRRPTTRPGVPSATVRSSGNRLTRPGVWHRLSAFCRTFVMPCGN